MDLLPKRRLYDVTIVLPSGVWLVIPFRAGSAIGAKRKARLAFPLSEVREAIRSGK